MGRGNAHFEAYGCAGEIRSAKGYLILWHDGADRLADALHDPIARARRWPRDLFELAGVGAVTLPAAVKKPAYRYKPSDQSRQTWAAAAAEARSMPAPTSRPPVPIPTRYVTAGRPICQVLQVAGSDKVQHRANTSLFFRPIGLKFSDRPQPARTAPSESKIGPKFAQEAIWGC